MAEALTTSILEPSPGGPHGGSACLLLRAADLVIALPAATALEVWQTDRCHPVPGTPSYVVGIASWRGVPLPLIDLAAALGLRRPEGRAVLGGRRVVVISAPPYLVGLAVEAALGVMDLSLDQARTPTVVNVGRLAELSVLEIETPRGVGALLDVESFLDAVRVKA